MTIRLEELETLLTEALDIVQSQREAADPETGGFTWSKRSRDRMTGVHPDLVKVLDLAIKLSPVDMTVIEGLRTKNRQRALVRKGASKTMNSRHLTGHAVDIAPLDNGEITWEWPLYHVIAKAIKAAAEEVGVPIEWGGDWESFKDGPHWQLPRKVYPK